MRAGFGVGRAYEKAVEPSASRLFLLSPASCGGQRAAMLHRSRSPLGQALRSDEGAPLGAVFTYLSSLYFRGKLTYAARFAAPPAGLPGALVITPGRGLRPPGERITAADLTALGQVDVDAKNAAFVAPLVRDTTALVARAPDTCTFVLLGSIATGKYVEPLCALLGERLLFPREFVGRGDMSRGGLLLQAARGGTELDYAAVATAVRRGPRAVRIAELAARTTTAAIPAAPRARAKTKR